MLMSGTTSLLLLAFIVCISPLGAQEVQTGYVDVGADRIWYAEAGSGDAVMLIHDGIVHSAGMRAQFNRRSEDYRVIRYDRLGYGKSDAPTEPYSRLANLVAIMDTLSVERAVLIAGSSGGAMAIEFALAHPDRVAGLVLVGAVVRGYGYTEHFLSRNRKALAPAEEGNYRAVIRNWSEDPWLMAPGNTEARERFRELTMPVAKKHFTLSFEYLEMPENTDLSRLSEIDAPTLIVTGEADIPDVHAHAGVIDVGIPNSERVVVPGAGHLVFLERPKRFNRLVLEFLDELSW